MSRTILLLQLLACGAYQPFIGIGKQLTATLHMSLTSHKHREFFVIFCQLLGLVYFFSLRYTCCTYAFFSCLDEFNTILLIFFFF